MNELKEIYIFSFLSIILLTLGCENHNDSVDLSVEYLSKNIYTITGSTEYEFDKEKMINTLDETASLICKGSVAEKISENMSLTKKSIEITKNNKKSKITIEYECNFEIF